MAERKKKRAKAPRRTGRTVPVTRRARDLISSLRRPQPDFRPDSDGTGLLKLLHITRLQRLILLRWVLYVGVCLGALLIQDVIMSRIHIMGATTDLPAAAILLITVVEGSEVGSLFALLTSIAYYFSGTAPGAYSVGMLTILGLLAGLFRQKFWHRSAGSIVLCAAIALMAYEIGLFAAGIFLGLTRWDRITMFLLTGGYSVLVLIPLYKLVNRIGLIGGNTWKE